MSKIIGVTVGTPTSPLKINDELKPVKTVNGSAPDDNGNVIIGAGDIGAATDFGFVESDEHPGCYYREVTKTVIDQEGNRGTIVEQEWLNPPMVSGNVYRTTKRLSGRRPVYVTRINLGKLPNSSSKMVDQQTATQHPDGCVDYAMFNLIVDTIVKVAPQIYYGESVYTHVDGAEIKASHYGGLYVECYADTTKDLSRYTCYVFVEFTATWDY